MRNKRQDKGDYQEIDIRRILKEPEKQRKKKERKEKLKIYAK